ncbi:sodium/bile acid cotransporter 5 [Echinops telfairi]|uniref:Sodium/bile acid cotransporter 5 n=1 Tax=Echinops telfairi TaxID=9371 RepID=A0AC55CQF2_ECHTE|nr:sodium/bile acid cotransporter 5 [Echinops telfairi]
MSGKLLTVLLLLSVTRGDAERLATRLLSIANAERRFFTKTEESIIVRSNYKEKRPNSSSLVVLIEDPNVLRMVTVTKTPLDVTDFTIHLVTGEDGQTNLTIQLWDSEGRQQGLLEEIKNVKVEVLRQGEASPFQASGHVDRSVLMLVTLPMILLNKCAFGCKIELRVLQSVCKSPLPVILGAATQFVLMPLCGFLLTRILALPEAQAFGFVMTCTCPGGGGGYFFALLLGGDITLAILMTCTSTVLALIMMPINSYLYSRTLGLSGIFRIPVSKIVSTLLFIITPISLGAVIKHRLPDKANFLEKLIRPLSFMLMSIGLYVTFRMGVEFLKTVNLEVFLLSLAIPALGLSLGYSFAKICLLPPPVCKTVAIESGMLNSFLALAIIQLSFSQPKAAEASTAPFTVAMCSACEMLLILLVYKARKLWILTAEAKRKNTHLV